ncbi:MAG TPA: DUF5668 domain-containing protein [Candidatus Polarisedimenticolia bacterium]|nr:DUF5668 domain-containing protein [Candidatus Polarisedimenticolia bacterium]
MGQNERDDARGMLIGGLAALGVGVIFLLHNLGVIPDMDVSWPIFPILAGVGLIAGALIKMRRAGGPGPTG